MSDTHARIDCTDYEGDLNGWVEVDQSDDGGLFVEVFDTTHMDGKTRSSIVEMTADQALTLAEAIRRITPAKDQA